MRPIVMLLLLVNLLSSFNSYSSIFSFEIIQENDSIKKKVSKWYEVIETKKMAFGGSKISYTVGDLNRISKNYLGVNTTRVIIEKWSDGREMILKNKASELVLISNTPEANVAIKGSNTKREITVYLLETYERMVENGVSSAAIYSQLADSYYYKNDFVKASKYYDALFKTGKNSKAELYFRYSIALKKLGQDTKSQEFLEAYEILIKSAQK